MNVTVWPLSWPYGLPRVPSREKGQFRTTLTVALGNVEDSLRRFGADSGVALSGIVLSSNVSLGCQRPADPGVAAWFTWDGAQRCIAVDRYSTVEANLQAIHLVLEARRVELRHGTLHLVRATLSGFKALPAPAGYRPWREVLGFKAATTRVPEEDVLRAYKRLAAAAHPDREGGSHEKMVSLNRARDEALKELAP